MPDNANWEEMLEEFMEDFNPDMVTISDPHKLQTLEEDIKMSDNYTIIDMWKKDLKDIKNIFSEKLGINQVSLLEIDNVD